VSVACVSAEAADPMRASGRQRYRDDCLDRSRLVACPLLQQNRHKRDLTGRRAKLLFLEVKADVSGHMNEGLAVWAYEFAV
jgi:hypothetical protein